MRNQLITKTLFCKAKQEEVFWKHSDSESFFKQQNGQNHVLRN
jgi:hypothetical protein